MIPVHLDDILKARLSTVGVEEHKLLMETNHESGKEWIIYDVGGSRSQRAAWAPFFDSGKCCYLSGKLSYSRRHRHFKTTTSKFFPGFHGVGQGLIDDVLIVTAIIFLAPISSFDEWLLEDPTVNRLVSSMLVLKIG